MRLAFRDNIISGNVSSLYISGEYPLICDALQVETNNVTHIQITCPPSSEDQTLICNALTSPHCKVRSLTLALPKSIFIDELNELITAVSSGATKVAFLLLSEAEGTESYGEPPDLSHAIKEMTRGKSTVIYIGCYRLYPSFKAQFTLDIMHPDCTIKQIGFRFGDDRYSKTINDMLLKRRVLLAILSSHNERLGTGIINKIPMELFRMLGTFL
jgi:radical SAM superfamily enzyme YgiQ (UPF0313 family)